MNTLVIDLDKSLLKIDLFKDTLGKSLLTRPWVFFTSVFIAIKNRAKSKTFIASNTNIEWYSLPFDNKVIDIITDYRGKGYQIILATGAPHRYAEPLADYLGLFDKVIATNADRNNVGMNKLEAIINEVGNDFIYLGDSMKDMPIWLHCKKAILVGSNQAIQKNLELNKVDVIDIVKKDNFMIQSLLKQLRIHQWSKNLLLFVPALASHQLVVASVFINALKGFIAYSLLESSIYVLNDILDVDHDRKHPQKKYRPIAAGDLSIFSAYTVLLVCFFASVWLMMGLGTTFYLVAGVYISLNLIYSFFLKRVIILDVIMLMSFYTIRLIAGHIPDTIPLSPWLLSFTIFLFYSLGLLKRYVDIIVLKENNITMLSGRGYSIYDGNMLMSLGVGSGLVSSLVLILYTGSAKVQEFYATPMVLVALTPVILYWISRLWLLAERGKIKSDPVLFVVKDPNSYIVAVCFILIMLIAKYVVI